MASGSDIDAGAGGTVAAGVNGLRVEGSGSWGSEVVVGRWEVGV